MSRTTWPRDRSTATGGGRSTARGGGLSTASRGGASTSSGGGMSTSSGGGLSTSSGGGLSTSSGGGLSTSSGGGLSTPSGGGLSTSRGGGLSTSPGGGLYTGSCANPYRSNTPPMQMFISILRQRGLGHIANILARAHHLDLRDSKQQPLTQEPRSVWADALIGHKRSRSASAEGLICVATADLPAAHVSRPVGLADVDKPVLRRPPRAC